MIEQGVNPETSTVEEFVEISERWETKENIYQERKHFFNSHDNSSSDDERHRNEQKQKHPKARNYQSNPNRKEFHCTEHGRNSTHNSSDCKVIHGKQANEDAWKNKDKSENECSDYKSKHKNKSRELNVLQMETKCKKAKRTKAHKNFKLTIQALPKAKASSSKTIRNSKCQRDSPQRGPGRRGLKLKKFKQKLFLQLRQ
jgi:hypothetical protein